MCVRTLGYRFFSGFEEMRTVFGEREMVGFANRWEGGRLLRAASNSTQTLKATGERIRKINHLAVEYNIEINRLCRVE